MTNKKEEVQLEVLSEKQNEEMARKIYDKLLLEVTNNLASTKKIDKSEMNRYIESLWTGFSYDVPKIMYFESPSTAILAVFVLCNTKLVDENPIGISKNKLSNSRYNFAERYNKFGEEMWQNLSEYFNPEELKKAKEKIDKMVEKDGTKYDWFLESAFMLQNGKYQLYLPLFGKFVLELHDNKVVDEVGFEVNDDIRKKLNSFYYIHSNCFIWGAFEKVCIMCENPRDIILNERYLPHSDNKAAIEFYNGEKIYVADNIVLPAKMFEAPQELSFQDIADEPNITVRMKMLKVCRPERLLLNSNAKLIDQDTDSMGPRKLYELNLGEQRNVNLHLIEVHTITVGGQDETFVMKIPSNINTCREAVAWTLSEKVDDYNPEYES